MLAVLLVLAIFVSAGALLYARYEYRDRGNLTWFGLFLLCAMLFMPNLVLEYATRYELPSSALDFLGVVIGLIGLAIVLAGMFAFRSVAKVLCLDSGTLTSVGPYRFSRNPQYVGYVLFLTGFALNDWSLWCLGALSVVAISLHLLVLIEEQHLHRTFGQRYEEFRQCTPRYLPFR